MATASRVLNLGLGLAGLLLGATPSAHAQNWDWTYQFTTTAHVDAHPIAVSVPNTNGFWAVGADALLHYTANGTLDHVNGNQSGSIGGLIGTLADGDVVILTQPVYFDGGPPLSCTISRYTNAGSMRWQQSFAAGACDLGIDGRDDIWIGGRGGGPIAIYSADGGAGSVDVGANVGIADFVVNPQQDGGAYAVTANSPAAILSLDPHGAVRWSWTDPTNAYIFTAITLASDGNLYAAVRSGSAPTGALSIVSLTTAGTLRFAHAPSDVQVSNVLAKAAAADGAVYFIDNVSDAQNQATELAVQRIGADGSVQWSRVLAGATFCRTPYASADHCDLSLTPEGDILTVAGAAGTQGGAQLQLFRYDGSGNLLFTHALDKNAYGSIVGLANGDALLTQGTDDVFDYGFLEIDRSGHESAAPATTQALAASTNGIASTFADDGTAYVWTDSATGPVGYSGNGTPRGPQLLSRISPAGQLVWSKAEDSTLSASSLSIAGNRLCVGETQALDGYSTQNFVACFNADTGEQLWSTVLDASGAAYFQLRTLDDGSVTVVHALRQGLEQVRFDANGVPTHSVALPNSFYTMAKNGLTILLQSDKTHLLACDANGAKIYDVATPASLQNSQGYYTPIVEVLADGSALVVFDTDDIQHGITVANAWSLNPSGATVWLKQISNGEPDYAYTAAAPLAANGNFYFVFGRYDVYAPSLQARSARGDLLWENPNIPGSKLLHDPLTGNIVVVDATGYRKLATLALAPYTGAVQSATYAPCPAEVGAGCQWNNFSISADGSLHADALVYNVASPSTHQLFALKHVGSSPPQVRLDQAGLDGLWYAPYESGQGFTLDYIDSAKMLFMPWFTFDQGDAIDPASLRWYALYGTITPGATGADLHIETAAPGSFVSGSVGTHDVGTAHLSFSDCASGTLFYQFNADTNNGAGGMITLTRLSPSAAPCALADGTTSPAQFPNSPAQGFDARQSGSWFDPATSGQGMEITIIPKTGSYPGLAFAAWFTFDPAGHSNDPTNQHWFTLEGDLAAASNGSTSLRILQTLGGAFDSQATDDTLQVGHATLTMQGCANARFDYQFDSSQIAHAFAGLSGTLNLVKIGGCTTP